MPLWLVFFSAWAVDSACIISAGSASFDFSALSGQVISNNDHPDGPIDFTFCTPNPKGCNSEVSSFCQTSYDLRFNLGLWSQGNWSLSGDQLVGQFNGSSYYCAGEPRQTRVTFACGGAATFASFEEVTTCVYEAKIVIPQEVCGRQNCCAPPAFSLKRVHTTADGLIVAAAVQQDTAAGNWRDETGQMEVLCLKSLNRCLNFNESFCVPTAYRPPVGECIRTSDGWSLMTTMAVVLDDHSSSQQTVWEGKNGHVETVDVGEGCVVVGGTGRDPALNVTVRTDPGLWAVPSVCVKFAQ